MSLHSDLPIYKSGCDLMSLAIRIQAQLPRAVKRPLGEKISHHCMQMLDQMAMANATRRAQRARHIEDLLTHQRALTVLLRVGHDNRFIPTTLWSSSVQLQDAIGKQGGGWLKSTTNTAPAA